MKVFTIILVLFSTDFLFTFAAKLGRNEDDRFTVEASGWEPEIGSGSGYSQEKVVGDSQAAIIPPANSPVKPIAPSSLKRLSTRSNIPISPANSIPFKRTRGAQSTFIPAVRSSPSAAESQSTLASIGSSQVPSALIGVSQLPSAPIGSPQLPSASIGSSQLPQLLPVSMPSVSKPAPQISPLASSLHQSSITQPDQASSSPQLQPSFSTPQMKPSTVPSVPQSPGPPQNLKPSVAFKSSDTFAPAVGQNRPTLVVNLAQPPMLVKPVVPVIQPAVPNAPITAQPSPYTKVPQPVQPLKGGPSVSAFSKVGAFPKSSSYAPQVASSASVLPNPSIPLQDKNSPKSSQIPPPAPVSVGAPKPQLMTQILTKSVTESTFNHAGDLNTPIPPQTRSQSLIDDNQQNKPENVVSNNKVPSKGSLKIEGSTNIVDITRGSGSGEGTTAVEKHIATALAQDTRGKPSTKSSKQSEQDPAKMIHSNVEKSLEDFYKHQEPFTFSSRPIARSTNKSKQFLDTSTKLRSQASGNTESQKPIQIKSLASNVNRKVSPDTPDEEQPVVIDGLHSQIEGDGQHEQPLPRLPPPLITINVEPPAQKVKTSDQPNENEDESESPKETADITGSEQSKGAETPQGTIVEVKIGFSENHQSDSSKTTSLHEEKKDEDIDLDLEQRRYYRGHKKHAKHPEPKPKQNDIPEADDTEVDDIFDFTHDDEEGTKVIFKKSEQDQIEQHRTTDSDEKKQQEETRTKEKAKNNSKHKHKRHHHHHHGKNKKHQQKHKGKSGDVSDQVYNRDSSHPETDLCKDDLSRFIEVNGFIKTNDDQPETQDTDKDTSEERSLSENGDAPDKTKHTHKERHEKKHYHKKSADLGEEKNTVEMFPLTTDNIGKVLEINSEDKVYSSGHKSGHEPQNRHHGYHQHKHNKMSSNDEILNSHKEMENMIGFTMLDKDLRENPLPKMVDQKVKKQKKNKHHRGRSHSHHDNHHERRHYDHKIHHHRNHD